MCRGSRPKWGLQSCPPMMANSALPQLATALWSQKWHMGRLWVALCLQSLVPYVLRVAQKSESGLRGAVQLEVFGMGHTLNKRVARRYGDRMKKQLMTGHVLRLPTQSPHHLTLGLLVLLLLPMCCLCAHMLHCAVNGQRMQAFNPSQPYAPRQVGCWNNMHPAREVRQPHSR